MDLLNHSRLGEPHRAELEERRKRLADVQAVTNKILNSENAMTALRRVGIGGNFTVDEEKIVCEDTGLNDSFSDLRPPLAKTHRYGVLALARRIATGEFSSVSDPNAEAFAFERTFTAASIARKHDLRISAKYLPLIHQELINSSLYKDTIKKMRSMRPELEKDFDTQLYEASIPIDELEFRILCKYGHLCSNCSIRALDQWLVQNNKSIKNEEDVLDAAIALHLPVEEVMR